MLADNGTQICQRAIRDKQWHFDSTDREDNQKNLVRLRLKKYNEKKTLPICIFNAIQLNGNCRILDRCSGGHGTIQYTRSPLLSYRKKCVVTQASE